MTGKEIKMSVKAMKLERAKKRLEMYYEAEESILSGAQSYSLGTRTLTRANLSEIRAAIRQLEQEVSSLEAKSARRAVAAVPRDF